MGSQFGVVGNAPPQPSSGRTVVVNESLNKVHQSNIGGAVTEQTGKFLGEAAHLAVTTFNNTLAASFVHQTMVQGRKVVRPASPITGGVAKIKSMQKKVERSNISYNRKHAVIKKQLNIVDSKGLSHNPTNTASASPLAANMTTPSKIGEVAKKIRATSAPSSRYLLNNTFQASKPISKSSGSIIPISVSTWGDEESPENNDKIYNMRKLNGSSPPRSPKSPRSPKLEINMHQPVINNSFKAPPAANFDTNGNNHKSSRKTAKISATVEELEILLSALCDAECSEDEMEMALETLHDCLAEDAAIATEYLYDLGCVRILMDLLRRTRERLYLQRKICGILFMLAENNDLVSHTIMRENGVIELLGIINKMSQNGFGGMSIDVPKMKSGKRRDGSQNQLASNSSMLSINDDGVQEVNLQLGILAELVDTEIIVNSYRMDKYGKQRVIEKLVTLLARIDLLFTTFNSISLESELTLCVEELMGAAQHLTSAESVRLYLIDPLTQELVFDNSSYDRGKKKLDILRFAPGSGIAGYVAKNNMVINVQDAGKHHHFDPDIDFCGLEDNAPFSLLCMPVYDKQGNVKGVFEMVNKQGEGGIIEEFTSEDENFLQVLSTLSGVFISNVQIFEKMSKNQKKVEVLLETTRMLGSTLDLDQLIKMIMDSAKGLLSADRCTLFLADVERRQLRALIQGRDQIQEIKLNMNSGIAGYVYTSGESVNIPDAYKDSRFNPEVDKRTGYVTRNILCMPIKNITGQSIGVTQMINKLGTSFGEDDEKILTSFSSQAAVAIEKSYLFKQTEDIRVYLQSILSSITSCVITLSEHMKLMTINRDWFIKALGVTQDFTMQNHADKWLGDENRSLMTDIMSVLGTNQPMSSAEYLLKSVTGGGNSVYVNYQIMPLIGIESKGVVLVLEDISSEKRAIMTLGRYMSPALAKQVMEEDGTQLGGKRKKVAILFTDIRSFTSLTESMEPPDVVEMLNHHFSDAVNAILAEQGILDKYIGDAVMAVFGVPFISPDDSIHACNAALRMIEYLKASNERRAAINLTPIKIGVGINTGMVLSGNIGSVKRMEFSCIGDAVNLSSRIEGLTKYYKVSILMTEYTEKETYGQFWTREVDTVIVMGRSSPVVLYELIGRKTPAAPPAIPEATDLPVILEIPTLQEQGLKFYAKALALYKNGDFQEAASNFALAIDICDDGPSKTMLERCQQYLVSPPDEWIVFKADHK